jgi:serine/threonine protein kinase
MEISQTPRKKSKNEANQSKTSAYSLSVSLNSGTGRNVTQSCSSIPSFSSLSIPSRSYKKIENKFIYFKKYVIGSGSFGKVLYGMNIDKTEEFAIKFEKTTVKNSVIGEEIKILKDLQGGVGIPEIYWHGRHEEYKVIVMDILGPSLDKFFKICGKKFNLETTVLFGIEMINRIEYMHSKGYLHRDIKPNNFLLGKFSRNKICEDNTMFIVDFGLSKSYLDEESGLHYDYKENRRFVGTPRYASLNTHVGIRQSRRDDIESIVYIIIYFLKGELPWQGVKAKTKSEKKEKIKHQKKFVTVFEMTQGLPVQFTELLTYVKNIGFNEVPNYDHIRNLLNTVRVENSFCEDLSNHEWEWNSLFLKSKQFKFKDEKIYNLFKKYYEKLYEGYPLPTYEEFLNYLENLQWRRNYKSNEAALASTEEKTSETCEENPNNSYLNKTLANTPVSANNFKILIDLNTGTAGFNQMPYVNKNNNLISNTINKNYHSANPHLFSNSNNLASQDLSTNLRVPGGSLNQIFKVTPQLTNNLFNDKNPQLNTNHNTMGNLSSSNPVDVNTNTFNFNILSNNIHK